MNGYSPTQKGAMELLCTKLKAPTLGTQIREAGIKSAKRAGRKPR